MNKILLKGITNRCTIGSEQLKTLTSTLLVLLVLGSPSYAQNDIKVGITASMPSVQVNHRGSPVEVKRIQDTNNRLVDDFSKTSRPCPPFCIHPMEAAPGVATVGELDVLDFVNNEVSQGAGLLIDARMPKFYNSETIPGSVNIPFVLFTSSANEILPLLGVENKNNSWDFNNANELLLWCNGPWCDQSPRAINALVQAGYPAAKLRYYRGGMQLWKIFGLTTIQPVSNEVGNN
jgi:rhodanese-related sulfurtransferase